MSTSPTAIPRPVTEHTATMSDGAALFYRAWLPATPTKKALLLFHRGHEHSGRWQETVEALRLDDVAVFAWDARGHGRSPGERGSAEHLGRVIQDVDEFVRHVSREHGIAYEDMIVMAHSVGAVTVSAWVHDFAPPIRALILATPAFRVKLYVPFAVPLLRLKQKLFGPGYVKSYVKANMLTHDAEQARGYKADPLIFPQIAVNILLDLYDTSTRLMADAAAINVPTLMLSAGADWVVKLSAQRRFFERLSSPVKRMEVFQGFSHAVFHEKHRAKLIAAAREFILDRFEQPPERRSQVTADKYGFTRDEYDRLREPGPLSFKITRLAMQTLGRMSRGISLGWRAGFDSGVTLDYVYENQPRGFTPLGRMMDKSYLESIGWRGIRQRRVHLERLLRATIEQTHAASQPVRVLDIAAGAGRYVLETLRSLSHIPITATLRDYRMENLDTARRIGAELGLTNVAFKLGDAFDCESLATESPKPTIGIVSGLFELFPDNEPILRSLRGLADVIEPGGHLIYTDQPWHPQVEFIARVLTNREGQPWIMRRRTQAEMDDLVRAAGFEKTTQLIDQWGIFSVAVARRS
jgi:alpha-beta hydrolase superfamily lysophospholipase/ubiquinone/menaquinone biosynthesis C-methylase UbiE